jgi:hypothetical protein
MKKLFEIVWCFIDEDGEVQRDSWENEIFYVAYIKAENIDDAERIWKSRQSYKRNAEVFEINEYVQV